MRKVFHQNVLSIFRKPSVAIAPQKKFALMSLFHETCFFVLSKDLIYHHCQTQNRSPFFGNCSKLQLIMIHYIKITSYVQLLGQCIYLICFTFCLCSKFDQFLYAWFSLGLPVVENFILFQTKQKNNASNNLTKSSLFALGFDGISHIVIKVISVMEPKTCIHSRSRHTLYH